MKFSACLALLLLVAGCGSSSSRRSNAPFGEAPAGDRGFHGDAILVSGNVLRGMLAWHDGLTLREAYVAAGYQGPIRDMQIAVHRRRELPITMDLSDLVHGQDVLLEPGDRLEITRKPQ